MPISSGELDYHVMKYLSIHKDVVGGAYAYGCAKWLAGLWGQLRETLYQPVRLRLKSMEKIPHPLVTSSTKPDATGRRKGKPRKCYQLTDLGKEKFLAMDARLKATIAEEQAKGNDDAENREAI